MSEGGVQREEASFEGGAAIERPMGRRRSDRIVGGGRATQEIVDQAMALARSDRPILICGPSGTGKDHLARAIHAWSSRAAQPFVAISCAAASPGLLARELFGCAEATYAQLPEEHVGALARAGGGALLRRRDRSGARGGARDAEQGDRGRTLPTRRRRRGDRAARARDRDLHRCAEPSALRRPRRTTSWRCLPSRLAARTCSRWRRTSCGSSPTRRA